MPRRLPEPDDDTQRVAVHLSATASSTPPGVGKTIGRYLVIGELGRGGMGLVLRAYDPRLQREVAVKILRPDRGGAAAQAALVREAQSMAKLSHPNVVGVYDVEPDGATVVLAMEYVEGSTLTKWLAAAPRSWREIVTIAIEAGRGLQAAHDAGVLHRDFKPSNVLIMSDGRAKVTDFGLARIDEALRARISDDGTPPPRDAEAPGPNATATIEGNASPETLGDTIKGTPAYMAIEQHAGAPLTPAADQFAFCVSLWQALVGSLPYAVRGRTMTMLANAKADGPPPWPKHVELPGPVVAAILRGLAPRPLDRWPSMAALLAELSEAVSGRRRAGLLRIAGAGALVAAVAGTALWWQYRRDSLCSGAEDQLAGVWDDDRRTRAATAFEATELPYAAGVWERVRPTLDDYAAQWVATHRESCEATSVRGEQSAHVMDLRMNCLRRARLQLESTSSALVDADAPTVEKAHALATSLPSLTACSDLEALQAEVPPPEDEADRAAVRDFEGDLAAARTRLGVGDYAGALARTEAIADVVEALGYEPIRTSWLLVTARAQDGLGEYAAAEASFGAALRSALQSRQLPLAAAAAQELILVVGGEQHRHGEGLAYAQTALGLAAALGPEAQARAKSSVANIYGLQGDVVGAESELRGALALWESTDATSLGSASARANLAIVLAMQGNLAEAESTLRAALTIYEERLGPEHPQIAGLRNNLAVMVRRRESASATGDAATASATAGAVAEARKAIAIYEKSLGTEHPDLAGAYSNLGNALRSSGKLAEAEENYRRAIAMWDATVAPDNPSVVYGLDGLGGVLMDLGRAAEAIAPLERAHALCQNGRVSPTLRGETTFTLAKALWEVGKDRARARSLATEALAAMGDDAAGGERREEVTAWLAAHR
jgi:tetratricopeptide (TPR) repeat protein/predicted Ser/Thr protein kinase